jgi:hypothetical protein
MSRAKGTTVLTAEQRDRAVAIGATKFTKFNRYTMFRERHVYSALDAAVSSMTALKFPNPYDGRVLGAFATDIIRHDPKVLALLRKRKNTALNTQAERDELFELIGLLVAEDYLSKRVEGPVPEPLLTDPRVLIGELDSLFDRMAAAGEALATETAAGDANITVKFPKGATSENLGRRLVDDAIAGYVDLIPQTDEGNDVPNSVERRAVSRAAFLRLAVDDLAEIASEEGMPALKTKSELVEALTARYGDDIDAVARLIIRRTEGDPGYGLVTRLLPLREVPDVDEVESVFRSLRNHYLEARPAVFFIFGEVERSDGRLVVHGKVRSLSVAAASVGGDVRMSPRPHTEVVAFTLRSDRPWVEVSVRRTSDLAVVRSVLIRSAAMTVAAGLVPPAPLVLAPYSDWDPRTLWMLDFLRRDLQAPEFRLDDTLMANFVMANPQIPLTDEERKRPNVAAVRLLGRHLHDHPEACARIASGAHLKDLEIAVRRTTNSTSGTGQLVRFRLSWEPDHFAVLSGADNDSFDRAVHREMVGLVRQAANRDLSGDSLHHTLREIERRATSDITAQDDTAGSILDAPDEAEVPV